jgi:hypothetical protein
MTLVVNTNDYVRFFIADSFGMDMYVIADGVVHYQNSILILGDRVTYGTKRME